MKKTSKRLSVILRERKMLTGRYAGCKKVLRKKMPTRARKDMKKYCAADFPLFFFVLDKPYFTISGLKRTRERSASRKKRSERYKKTVPYSVKLPV
jgi:hypothetical protein